MTRGKTPAARPGRAGAADPTSLYGSRSKHLRKTIGRTVKRSQKNRQPLDLNETPAPAEPEPEPATSELEQLRAECAKLRVEAERLQRACDEGLPRERILCPRCGKLHIEGARFDRPEIDGRTRPHHTHRCYHCGRTWESGRWSFGVDAPPAPELEGRTTAPTQEEIQAHEQRGGWWRVVERSVELPVPGSRGTYLRGPEHKTLRWVDVVAAHFEDLRARGIPFVCWPLDEEYMPTHWPETTPGTERRAYDARVEGGEDMRTSVLEVLFLQEREIEAGELPAAEKMGAFVAIRGAQEAVRSSLCNVHRRRRASDRQP